MTSEEIQRRVNAAFVEEFELSPERLVPEARLREDLELDSLDFVDMILVLESATQIQIKGRSGLENIKTLGDVYIFLEKLGEDL